MTGKKSFCTKQIFYYFTTPPRDRKSDNPNNLIIYTPGSDFFVYICQLFVCLVSGSCDVSHYDYLKINICLYIWCDEKYLPNIPQQPAIMKNKIFYLPLIILLPIVNIVKSDVGGHDLFTSLAQLEVLWYNEIETIKVMERAITNMEKATKSLQK